MSFIQFSVTCLLCVIISTSCAGDNKKSDTATSLCDKPSRVDSLPTILREASGVAASRAHDGILWVNNDSNNPFTIFALDTLAHLIGHVRVVTPLTRMDWEDIAVSHCNDRDCIYLADIGDNHTSRSTVSLLRFPEPDPAVDTTVTPVIFPIRFPDGPHDAEALFILPDERVFIITKGRNGPVALYAYPGPLRPDTVTLQHLRNFTPGIVQFPNMVTGASASADGAIVAVRTYSYLRLFKTVPGPGATTDIQPLGDSLPLAALREFQGEGVTIASNTRVFLVGEKGFDTLPPPLSRMACKMGQ